MSAQQAITNEAFDQGVEIGLDYWFRLKNQRVEFFPEVTYSKNPSISIARQSGSLLSTGEIDYDAIGFNANTRIYFLDFNSDCDCPTFSKQSEFIPKGLFALISPGVKMNVISQRFLNAENSESINSRHWSYRVGIGFGFDFGLSDLLTVTPFAQYNLEFNHSSEFIENFNQFHNPFETQVGLSASDNRQLQFGIRLGFRPDYNE